MTYVIAEPCIDVKDKSCLEECPVNCIYEGERMLYIHPDECVDCGACEPVCPVEAIFYEDEVPPKWFKFIAAGEDFVSRMPAVDGGPQHGFDSPLALLPVDEGNAAVSTPSAEANAIAATEPGQFFQGHAGTRIAVLWDMSVIDLEVVKALLLVFDKVAVIGKSTLTGTLASEADQWQLLAEMDLVAQVPIADTVALVEIDSVRALAETLLAGKVATRQTSNGQTWQRSIAFGAFRRLDNPTEMAARASLRDPATLEVVSTVICWMFEESVAARGVSVHDVTADQATVKRFEKVAARLDPTARTVTLPCEWVLPSCDKVSIEQLMDFRTTAGPSYRRYLGRLIDAMTSLSQRTDSAARAASYSPEEVADEVYALRRIMRDLPWLGRGYVGFGLTGNAGLPQLRDTAAVAQTVGTRGTPQQANVKPRGVFLTNPARGSWI